MAVAVPADRTRVILSLLARLEVNRRSGCVVALGLGRLLVGADPAVRVVDQPIEEVLKVARHSR